MADLGLVLQVGAGLIAPRDQLLPARLELLLLAFERRHGRSSRGQARRTPSNASARSGGRAGRRLALARGRTRPAHRAAPSNGRLRLGELSFRLREARERGLPADDEERRFEPADLGGDFSVAHRLPRLTAKLLEPPLDLGHHVVQPPEVLLRRAELLLRLVAAGMQAGNAGGVLQDAAPLLRLRRDQLRHLPLAYKRRGMRAGGSVGEEDLHVAGAHLAPVDAVARPELALDPPRDLDRLGAAPVPSSRSAKSVTSAVLRDGRAPEPEKITSSIPPPRIALYELSPMTKRSASTRLDFPQPFGPTMPVTPGWIGMSMASAKDLNPCRRMPVDLHGRTLPRAGEPPAVRTR